MNLRLPPRSLALLLLVSCGLRFVVWLAVVNADVPLIFDESGYFSRATAIHQIFVAWGSLEAPPAEVWERAYGHGHWPPLHPLVLAAGMTIGGPTVAVARSVMVVVSALTTVLVYCLALRAGGRKAALAAGWLYALYPTFIAYSHYLWSETTTIFLLLAAMLAVPKPDAATTRRGLIRAAAAGALLGLAALSRAAVLPMLPAVALYTGLTAGVRRRRLAVVGVTLAAGILVLLPWQGVLCSREGRLVALSTLGGYNLALGNHSEVPPGLGSSWGHEASKARLRATLDEAARQRSVTWQTAAYSVAVEEIRQRPGAAAVRAVERLRMLWAPDYFPLRHLFGAVYPPVPPPLALLAAAVAVAAYLGLTALAVCGLPGDRLTLVCVAAGMVLPALTIANSRLHLPLLALTLPAAGRTLAHLLARRWRPRPIAVILWLALAAAALTSLPKVIENYLLPSGYYAVLGPVGSRLGAEPVFADRVFLRRQPGFIDAVEVEVLSAGARFADGSRLRRWPGGSRRLSVGLASGGDGAVEIEIRSPAGDRRAVVRPLSRQSWRAWRDSGVDGVDVLWSGAALKGLRTRPSDPRARKRR